MDKVQLNEFNALKQQKNKKLFALIIACLFSLSLTAIWMLLEYYTLGEIVPNKIDDIIMIPVTISFYFNGKQIVETYCK